MISEEFREDVVCFLTSFFGGLLWMLKPSRWKWMKQTKEEYNHLSWLDVMGIVLYGDYRRKKHFDRMDDY